MIVFFLITKLLGLLDSIFSWLPAIENIEVSLDMLGDAPDYLRVVLYVLPIYQLTPLFSLILAVSGIRVFVSGFRFIKGCIPFMSA